MLLAAALPLLSAVSLLLPRQITLTLSAPETVGRGEQMTCTLTVSSSGIPAQFELTVEAENSFTGEYSTRVMPLSVGKKAGIAVVAACRNAQRCRTPFLHERP